MLHGIWFGNAEGIYSDYDKPASLRIKREDEHIEVEPESQPMSLALQQQVMHCKWICHGHAAHTNSYSTPDYNRQSTRDDANDKRPGNCSLTVIISATTSQLQRIEGLLLCQNIEAKANQAKRLKGSLSSTGASIINADIQCDAYGVTWLVTETLKDEIIGDCGGLLSSEADTWFSKGLRDGKFPMNFFYNI